MRRSYKQYSLFAHMDTVNPYSSFLACCALYF